MALRFGLIAAQFPSRWFRLEAFVSALGRRAKDWDSSGPTTLLVVFSTAERRQWDHFDGARLASMERDKVTVQFGVELSATPPFEVSDVHVFTVDAISAAVACAESELERRGDRVPLVGIREELSVLESTLRSPPAWASALPEHPVDPLSPEQRAVVERTLRMLDRPELN